MMPAAGEVKLNRTLDQFWRYAVIGVMNTAIDFAVLNLLSAITGIHKGNALIPLNVISFSIAITNSYYFNNRWSFQDRLRTDHGRKLTLFLLVSIIGAIINTTIVRLITTDIQPIHHLSPQLWENVAKIVATVATLLWNFTGYKLVVFKK